MSSRLCAALFALCWCLPASVSFAGPSVAFPKAKGPKPSGIATIEGDLRQALTAGGFEIISGKPLASAAKRADAPPTSAAAGKAAGADFVVALEAKKIAKKKFVVEIEVRTTADDRSVYGAKEGYKGAKDAKRVSAKIAGPLLAALEKNAPAETDEDEPVAAVTSPVVPKDEGDEPVAAVAPAVVPKDEASASSASAEVTPGATGSNALPLLRAAVSIGTQGLSAYAVSVGGAATALAYELSPLLLLGGSLRFDIPDVGVGVEAAAAFAPVKYALDTMPAVTPREPGGRFLDFGAAVFYRLELSGAGRTAFALEPLVGIQYSSMSVEEQSRNVVLSWNAVQPQFGARGVYGISEDLDLELDLRFRLIVSYSESPQETGESGSGFGFRAGGGGHYWIAPQFGVGLDVTYEYAKIGMTGTGDRERFENDPTLTDASIASSALRAALSLILAI